MHKLAIAAFALISASALGLPAASAQTVDREVIVGQRSALTDVGNTRDPNTFAARSRRQMDRIRHHAENEVARGRLAPHALRRIDQQRSAVESLLSRVGADGRIGRRDRRAVDNRLYDMRAVAYGTVAPPPPIGTGGGPSRYVWP